MGRTVIEKILSRHADRNVKVGEIADIKLDVRVARDFGGANVVNHLRANKLGIDDPSRTYFTFDCNSAASDQKFATNQLICRQFAREYGIKVYDVNWGIGSHVAIDEGLVKPGSTFVSTDSHANIIGAIGAFGQGMGDQDIAAGFAYGRIWFKVPKTIKLVLKGSLPPGTSAKDLVLRLLETFGADGLLGYAVEVYGDVLETLSLSARITVASMVTEMGGIIMFFPPNDKVIRYCQEVGIGHVQPVYGDDDAVYDRIVEVDIHDLEPLISRPGHPEDVITVREVAGTKIDSAFVGSCTNSRFEDMVAVADILKDRKVAPGVILRIVPGTRKVWQRCLDEGLMRVFMSAGAIVGNPGCAGCAVGQIGQNGLGEVTVSTGNRNYAGKQGKGDVYLASPSTVAASAVAGVIINPDEIPGKPVLFPTSRSEDFLFSSSIVKPVSQKKPVSFKARVWVIRRDNIDTDMIFHNRYLAVTDFEEMAKYALDNLNGWEDFSKKSKPGDVIVTGSNFGAGSSRQQAVDCFKSLGIRAIIAKSFGAIYERNAINSGFLIITSNLIETDIESGEEISVDLKVGRIRRLKNGQKIKIAPFVDIQMEIYQKGGLLQQ